MNKDNEIKEIAKILNECCGVYDEYGNHIRNKCYNCEYWSNDNGLCCSYNKKEATELYNAGYRKLPQKRIEGNHVYTDSTLKSWTKEQLIEQIRILEYNWQSSLNTIENQADNYGKLIVYQRTETAQQILGDLYKVAEIYGFVSLTADNLRETLEKYGVEVK